MSSKNNEARLWQKVKKGLTDCFLTRIESSTINGIPDIHAVHKQEVFWIELKSDSLSYPALNKWQVVWINKYVKAGGKVIILKENLGKTPLQSVLKLYRPVSLFTEPRSLVPRFSFSAPYNWTLVQQQVLRELGSMHSSA
jgi:Holliday junction resolvase